MNRKLLLFVIFVIAFSLPLFLVQRFTNIDFEKLSLAQFGPALAYILTIILFKDLFISIKVNISIKIIGKILISMIIPLFLYSITYFIGKIINIKMQLNVNIPYILLNYGLGIIIGAIGEEIGWRSFLQPMLDKKYPIIVSSVIVGLIWDLWHINHYINGII